MKNKMFSVFMSVLVCLTSLMCINVIHAHEIVTDHCVELESENNDELLPLSATNCNVCTNHVLGNATMKLWCNICGKQGSIPILKCTNSNCNYSVPNGEATMGCECQYPGN